MKTIGLISKSRPSQWLRYFPNSTPYWNGTFFQFEGDFTLCDIVFVYDAVPNHICGRIKHDNIIFLAAEPPSIKKYNDDFLAQFTGVYSVDQSIRHPNLILGRMPSLWHIGLWDETGSLLESPLKFDDFKNIYSKKSRNVSVISSSKAYTVGHRSRLDFVDKIKSYFGDEIDVFGRGRRSFGDKIEVIPQYRYHIALENSSYYDYWTEKLSDAFLSLTFPIYNGCPNIEEYFEPSQLSVINIRDIESSIRTIRKLIDSDISEESAKTLEGARERVLKKYNVINLIYNISKYKSEKYIDNKRHNSLLSEEYFERYSNSFIRHCSASIRNARMCVEASLRKIMR